MSYSNIDTILDLKGLTCPVPLMRLKKTLKSMEVGNLIKMLITDPNTQSDLDRFCLRGNCRVADQNSDSDHHVYIIEKLA